ncbi:MAG: DNA repair protein RecN [Gammaproteobacteria bacterium]|jgi:DNA repair protein RecN (Recombination protein N)|nr:DNA repair protein RecN [Gammaproteobacteria bacterium]MCP4879582.1 DNA repair protein RecN [Gammaproteobacteria bacterium]MDP6166260.1 DNA repair protein RecN [Gammaproteobacteria bacterium]
MLQQLIVQHFALVDFLHLDFNRNMTAISGETGAGKSILLDALGLTLGDRAESGCVRQGADKADIHAVFDLHQLPAIRDYLASKHLASNDDPDICILRRIINQDGRSRGYINGKPVNIATLKLVGQQLINIHGQHEHQHLLARDSHLQLLDAYGHHQQSLQAVMELSQQWQEIERQIKSLTGDQQLNDAERQLLQYQVNELEALELVEGQLEQLEQEHKQLAKADQLQQAVAAALPDNDRGDDPKANLQRWRQELQEFAEFSPQITNAIELLTSAAIQVEESQYELQSFMQGFDQDPTRLASIELRLDQIYCVARKHKVQPNLLLSHLHALQARLLQNENQEADLQALAEEQQRLSQTYTVAAQKLTQERQSTAEQLQQAVATQLSQLGMSQCRLQFAITPKPTTDLPSKGMDDVEMLIQTNPGQPAKPLAKIASGGELSRISLAIQVVIASTSITPCLIFDEVDVGIGGATAEIVGRLLAQLGQHCQLLCITHLPQVASQAQHHLQVSKHHQDQITHTQVVPLSKTQRVQEIARMLGGITLTEQTLAHAKEMLGTNALH